jgi:hypothetical protein
MHQRTLTRVGVLAVALATLLVGLAATTARAVGAQTPGDAALLVTDYENYPDTPQTAVGPDCDAEDIALNGVRLNGGPLVANLAALPELATGDTVTAELASGPDCVGGILSLTIKAADTPTFDPGRNQRNVAFSYDSVVALGEGRTTLVELIIPPMPDDDCFYQLDIVTGYPLAVVGPDGSFYNPASRGDQLRNMLVDFRNGALTACAESATTTTGSTTSTTASTTSTTSTTGAPPTTTPPSTTTTVQPPSTTVAQAVSAPPASVQATGGGTTTATVLGARVGTIPATGPGYSGPLAVVGMVILLIGAALLAQGWRLRRS